MAHVVAETGCENTHPHYLHKISTCRWHDRSNVTMHPFNDFCRHALDDIRAQGRYRSFTALRKVAS
jgi:hypothetical protein